MNIPFISNIRPRIIMAPTPSVSASLHKSRASPPQSLAQCSEMNADTLTHRPAYLLSYPLLFYLLHYNSPSHPGWKKTPFLYFLPTIFTKYSKPYWRIPKCLSPFTILHLYCWENNRCLVSYLWSRHNKQPKWFPLFFTYFLPTNLRHRCQIESIHQSPKSHNNFEKGQSWRILPSWFQNSPQSYGNQQCGAGTKADIQTNENSIESPEISPHVYGQLILWQLGCSLREWWFGSIMSFTRLDRTSY